MSTHWIIWWINHALVKSQVCRIYWNIQMNIQMVLHTCEQICINLANRKFKVYSSKRKYSVYVCDVEASPRITIISFSWSFQFTFACFWQDSSSRRSLAGNESYKCKSISMPFLLSRIQIHVWMSLNACAKVYQVKITAFQKEKDKSVNFR